MIDLGLAHWKQSTMLRQRSSSLMVFAPIVSVVLLLNPQISLAGINADLAKCTAAKAPDAAKACSRVLRSGRLPKRQLYIAHFNRGWAYRNSRKYKEALRDFSRSISLNSKHADSYYSRAVVHYDLGNIQQSIDDLDLYQARHKKKATALFKRALMLRRLSKTGLALSALQQASKITPKDNRSDTLQAILQSDTNDHKNALSLLNEVIARAPEYSYAYYARGLVLYRQNRLAGAQEAAEKALRLKKQYTEAFALLGLILEKQNRRDTARIRFEQAIMSKADNVESLYAQEEARDWLRALKQTSDDNPKVSQLPADTRTKDCRRFIPSAAITIAVPCPK